MKTFYTLFTTILAILVVDMTIAQPSIDINIPNINVNITFPPGILPNITGPPFLPNISLPNISLPDLPGLFPNFTIPDLPHLPIGYYYIFYFPTTHISKTRHTH